MIPPSEEKKPRRECVGRYRNQQKRDAIDTQIQGIDMAIQILQEKRADLKAESDGLKPARRTGGRGGA